MDSSVLADNYLRAVQICERIDTSTRKNSPGGELETLYELLLCYQEMYTTLLDHSLITNGPPKTSTTKH